MIPKIIHYCWFGGKIMNPLQLRCIESWKTLLPDFQIKEWNESNFDIKKYPYAKTAFEYGKYAFVADVCRLVVLYENGGLYMDLDMLVLKNLEPFLHHDFFLGFEDKKRFSAGIIGAKKNNLELKKLISEYSKIEFNCKNPILIPDFFISHINPSEVFAYSEEYFYPLPFSQKEKDFSPYLSENSFAVHLWDHSWIGEQDYLKNKEYVKAIMIFVVNLINFPITRNRLYILDFLKSLYYYVKTDIKSFF